MQAFPVNVYEGKWNEGMELRDYFAAKAMQALLSTTKDEQRFPDEVTSIAYEVADAMIKARGKEEEE